MKRRTLMLGAFAYPLVGQTQLACGLPTPEDMEGPFYKAGAPARASLVEPGTRGERLVLSGVVSAADCRPLADVALDFWHADETGAYDNAGYRYRGLLKTDTQGRYRLETILPPPYAGRPRHIHVKLLPPRGRVLTTQLYFPGESRGADRNLVVKLERRDGLPAAVFDFVLGR